MSHSDFDYREYQRTYQKNRVRTNFDYFLKRRLSKLKQRSKNKDIAFNLDFDYLKELWETQNGLCSLTGVSMTNSDSRTTTTISVDRINPKLGYVKGNIRFICDIVNKMKQELNDDELKLWCHKILRSK